MKTINLENILEKNSEKVNRISITGAFNSGGQKFEIAIDFLEELLIQLRMKYPFQKIFLIEKRYKDIKNIRLESLLRKYNCNYYNLDHIDSLIEFTGMDFNNTVDFYINKKWLDSDLKIIITKSFLHKHHSIINAYTPLDELALFINTSKFDWTKMKRNDSYRILRDDTVFLYNSLKKILGKANLVGVADCRNLEMTNEHIPFYKKKYDGEILISSDLLELRNQIISLTK